MFILAGDFNTHHPLWNPTEYLYHDEEADTLVEVAASLGLNLMLPSGTITYPNAGTAIDLVWGNNEAMVHTLSCKIADQHDHTSDHLPIETTIALPLAIPELIPPYNYAKTNWQELNTKVKSYLPSLLSLNTGSSTAQDIDLFAEKL